MLGFCAFVTLFGVVWPHHSMTGTHRILHRENSSNLMTVTKLNDQKFIESFHTAGWLPSRFLYIVSNNWNLYILRWFNKWHKIKSTNHSTLQPRWMFHIIFLCLLLTSSSFNFMLSKQKIQDFCSSTVFNFSINEKNMIDHLMNYRKSRVSCSCSPVICLSMKMRWAVIILIDFDYNFVCYRKSCLNWFFKFSIFSLKNQTKVQTGFRSSSR